MKAILIPILSAAALILAACDEPAPWARPAKAPPGPQTLANIRAQKVVWNEAAGGFEVGGKPLKAGRLWTFDGSTEGFVLAGGSVLPASPVGLSVRNVDFDPILRSPKGLELDGSRYSLVLVRLTRHRPGAAWDGTIFYSTADHAESGDFRSKPVEGAAPAVGETVVLVYDMAHPKKGGEDWTVSLIDSLRIDTDDQAGGTFTIHQIAVTENPGTEALGVAPPPADEAKTAETPKT
ncbi:hypothetical protein [Phenylobacterium sp.]|uniref:hypothetical protein n=1 Tax=Phenylobacterium sp. TaxID=1871053 RepID=UPI0027371457|nr:hypothetical protein [Phenylobacterium sp.]MDP3856090.1 hypothetical protein [Phenylobacterium sp.]